MSEPIIGHILFEGSSTARGMGDETHRLGYAGRLSSYYDRYGTTTARQNKALPCRFVYTHLSGQPDYSLLDFAGGIKRQSLEALSLSSNKIRSHDIRLVGVFAVGSFLSAFTKKHGENTALREWGRALDHLEQQCTDLDVHTIAIAPPMPDPDLVFPNGIRPDFGFRQEIDDLSAKKLAGWATYTHIDDLLGGRKAECMAADKLHVNAQGYDIVTNYLRPLINSHLGIDDTAN